MSDDDDITGLLREPSGAGDRLWALVYPELKRRARRALAGERASHTLSATAVVHEVYVRLRDTSARDWDDRTHFYNTASRVMRNVLIDYGRARRTRSRAGRGREQSLEEEQLLPEGFELDEEGALRVQEALDRLAERDERAALVVAMRAFGGLTRAEIAKELGVVESTVSEKLKLARSIRSALR